MLSTKNCRTSRPWLAPNAIRAAISRCRPTARDSRRFATLAQAISNTNPTATRSTSSAGLMYSTRADSSGTSTVP